MKIRKSRKVEPIYEKLAPNEVFIISKEENCVIYAVNKNGEIILKKAYLIEKE